ncbi:glycosyltransferase family 2 protein [uncultured Hymenobacter sp.]|uniref:glycosyltransferase family 2 protein n=1 Tax=uncultured Hymenobacter sp. TaxID=170016 RepID=UPI0035CA1407
MTSSLYPSYTITHVDLASQKALPELNYQGQGNYIVFWWKEIALGHLFIEPNCPLSEQTYHETLLNVIKPTLERYAARHSLEKEPWANWVLQRNFKRWDTWLNSVFVDWRSTVIPQQVPVSVIICTRNRAPSLQLCLESLRRMVCQPAEIIVVDNAPSDTSTLKVTKAYPNLKYVAEIAPGLSYARNTGVKKAACDIIAFTDDDVQLHPDWLYRVWETFLDEKIVAMTGLVIAAELQTEAQQIFEKHWSFNRGYDDVHYDIHYWAKSLRTAPPVWDIGAGANSAFRKSVFKEAGLFNEKLGAGASGCSEDSEMWFRILIQGHSIHYNPRAVVYHTHRKRLTDLERQLFYYMRGHAAAALIQHEQQPQAGYARHLWRMPRYYAYLLRAGFPFYRFRSRTLWSEVKGLVSGVVFYYQNRGS